MNFIAIDFETANRWRTSACSIGVVKVENGEITESFSRLIRPEPFYFEPINIQIHGIHPEMVQDAPNFSEVWQELAPMFKYQTLVAHNAAFDMSVLRHTLDVYEEPYPEVGYLCSCRLAKKVFPEVENHKLSTLAAYFNIPLDHHEAESDARAAAEILIRTFDAYDVQEPEALAAATGFKVGWMEPFRHQGFGVVKPSRKSQKKR